MTEIDRSRDGSLGVLAYISISIGIMGFWGVQNLTGRNNQPLINCDNGIRDASLDLILQKNQSFSIESINGNKDILIAEDVDGALTVNIHNNSSITAHLPSGETIIASQLQIKPETSVLLEDKQVIYDIKNTPNEKGSEIQIKASCKN